MLDTDTPPALHPLEQEKLRAEIRKIEVETSKSERELGRMERMDRTHAADADEHHRLSIWGTINAATCAYAISKLDQWSREDPGCDITLTFNSPGGNVIDGLALYDFIQEMRTAGHKITTVALGMAASMGGVLLQAGDHRVAGRNAFVLIHEVGAGAMGKMSELEDEVAFCKRLQERLVDILARRSTLTVRQIKTRWARKDWWLSADEALTLGFIDEVRAEKA